MIHAAEEERPDVQQERQEWAKYIPGLGLERPVFLDETWATTNMSRRYGRAPVGERLVDYAPFGHWKVTTFVGALRHDGPVNGAVFLAYVEQVLVPTLKEGEHRHHGRPVEPRGGGGEGGEGEAAPPAGLQPRL